MKCASQFLAVFLFYHLTVAAEPIDSFAVVTRDDVVLTNFDAANPLSVGNGCFCFTVDATGLQTFPKAFTRTTPLSTLSKWLLENSNRLNLAQIGLVLKHADGSAATTNDLTDIHQKLDLWNGRILSRFKFDGEPVQLETLCDPKADAISVYVISTLVCEGRLAVQIHFPDGIGDETSQHQIDTSHAEFCHKLGNGTYFVAVSWTGGGTLTNTATHQFEIAPSREVNSFEVVCAFSPTNIDAETIPTLSHSVVDAAAFWNSFWKRNGAIDLSGSKEPGWFEPEQQKVLSEYLDAIQCVPSRNDH
jgi:protein-glucosylgalactosylhydroxylysine glucosidase